MPSLAQLVKRDGPYCRYCGVDLLPAQMTRDHVIPRSRGGSGRARNLVVCCSPCNGRKADRTPAEAGMVLRDPRGPMARDGARIRGDKVQEPLPTSEFWRDDYTVRAVAAERDRRERAAVASSALTEVEWRALSKRDRFAMDRSLFPPYVIRVSRGDKVV